MDFYQKLQELRKQKGLTQEQLAEQLYVSRTAISKWESGRGYPNIDSLKELSKYFGISLDELLSSEEILNAAQEDSKHQIQHFQDLVFGLLDCSIIVLLFLPFFGQKVNGIIEEVSMLSLTQAPLYVKIPYLMLAAGLFFCGVLTLAFQNAALPVWLKMKGKLSLGLSVVSVVLFIVTLQPYAAVFTFLFLMIKALMLIKWS